MKFLEEYVTVDDVLNDYIYNTNNLQDNILSSVASLYREFGFVYTKFIPFIYNVLELLSWKSSEPGNFEAYKLQLNVILNIFIKIPLDRMPQNLFTMLAEALNKVLLKIDERENPPKGTPYKASKLWKKEKKAIPVKDALYNIYKSNPYAFSNLYKLDFDETD